MDVLALLDREIENVVADRDAGGWTQWAMIGALAATLLLVVNTWEGGGFAGRGVVTFFLIAWLIYDVVLQPLSRRTTVPRANGGPTRFVGPEFLRANRPVSAVFAGVYTIVAASLLTVGFDLVPRWVVWVAAAVYIAIVFSAIEGLILGYFPIPIPEDIGQVPPGMRRAAAVSSALTWVAPATVLALVISRFRLAIPGARLPEFKLGIAAAVSVFIILQLVRRHHEHVYPLRSLRGLRARLLVNDVDVPRAIEEWRAITLGLNAADLFRDQVLDMLGALDRVESQYGLTLRTVATIASTLEAYRTDPASAQGSVASDAVGELRVRLAAVRDATTRVAPDLQLFERRKRSAVRRAQIAIALAPDCEGDLTRTLAPILERFTRLTHTATQINTQYDAVEAALRNVSIG